MQDDYPGTSGIPLRPGDPETKANVGVEVVDKPNHVVPEFSQKEDISGLDRGYEIRPVDLKGGERKIEMRNELPELL